MLLSIPVTVPLSASASFYSSNSDFVLSVSALSIPVSVPLSASASFYSSNCDFVLVR